MMRLFSGLGLGLIAFSVAGLVPTPAAAEWTADVRSELVKKQSYPRSAQIRGEEGTAKISITVEPDGTISNIELVQKTGSSILDREALRMPAKVGRVAPTPDRKPRTLIIPVAWRL